MKLKYFIKNICVKFVLFTLSGLKVKEDGFRVKFVKVCEWFDRCDRLAIIFILRKNKITKLSFILKWLKIIIV